MSIEFTDGDCNDSANPIGNEADFELIASKYREIGCSRRVAVELQISRKKVMQVLAKMGLMNLRSAPPVQTKRAQYLRELRDSRREANLCYRCGDAVLDGRAVCARHHDIQRRATARRKGIRAAAGVCADCRNPPLKNSSRCGKCLERHRELNALKSSIRTEHNLCALCGKKNDSKRKMCSLCRSSNLSKLHALKKTRQESGLCCRCGKTPDLLSGKDFCLMCYMKQKSTDLMGTISEANSLLRLWEEQDGLCPYTGLKLTLGVDAHLDHRIPVSKRGATSVDNLQWIHKDVNTMKGSMSEADFIAMVHLIASRHPLPQG